MHLHHSDLHEWNIAHIEDGSEQHEAPSMIRTEDSATRTRSTIEHDIESLLN